MSFVSMFCGIGGGDLGLAHSGWKCVWANDVDKYACRVYWKNFPSHNLIEGDIRDIKADTIPDHDLLIAGFPCQSFSIAGKRKGLDESRGTLFWHIARIAKAKRPKLLLLENVKGLLSNDSGRTFATIIRLLAELGYVIEWQVLNSKYFGVPQNRERVFIIGHLRGSGSREIFPIVSDDSENCEVGEVAGTLQGGGHSGGLHSNMTAVTIYRHPLNYGKRALYSESDIYPSLRTIQRQPSKKLIANSIDTSGYLRKMGRHEVGKYGLTDYRIRRLTPIECERLQGFPDNYTEGVSDTQRYKLLGNAMTVNVIEYLGKLLLFSGGFSAEKSPATARGNTK